MMKRILLLVVLLLVAVVGLSFALLNSTVVELNYYLGSLQAPLSLVVVLAMAFGAALGVLASVGVVLRLKREMAKLRKTTRLTQKEVANLRSLPLRDSH